MPKEQSLTSWQQSYVTRIVNEIKKDGKQTMDDLYWELKKGLETKIDELTSKLTEFSDFYEKLFNWTEEDESIKAEIEWYIEELTWKLGDIQEKYNTLIDWENWIIKNHEEATNMKNEIGDLLDEVSPLVDEFNEYYDKVFWKEDENWKRKWWLKEEIEKREKEYTELKDKIERLLPWATSAWLASAYENHKNTFKDQKNFWSYVFMGALLWMLLSYIATLIWQEVPDVEWWRWSIFKLFVRLPMTIPFVWLALFAGKQQNKYQRLEQEYAYKESLSRSFEWYRKEIEKIEDLESAKQLEINLFNVIIEMNSYNPSKTLESKSNDEKSPYWTIFEKILEKMDDYLKTVNSLLENIWKISK